MFDSGLRSIRLALYTRVSTEDQAKDGYSLDAQLARLTQYADFVGSNIAGHYEDDGHSGRTTKRPGYEAMMAAHDTWDAILVMKMDRIHRNVRNFLAMMDWLKGKGKNFVSANEQLDTTTPHGRFFMVMLQGLAELESDVIGDRVKEGLGQKLREGPTWVTEPPFGYDMHELLGLVANDRAPWVPRMYHLAAGTGGVPQLGSTSIANFLNGQGIKTRREAAWQPASVRYVLSNRAYLGELHSGSFSRLNNHQPLVDTQLFNLVQDALAKRKVLRE